MHEPVEVVLLYEFVGDSTDRRALAAEGLPDLLTVEEAAAVLRISRTKAYALTQEWRASGGRSGLPVIDLGDTLRVPRRALERMLGVELTGPLITRPYGGG